VKHLAAFYSTANCVYAQCAVILSEAKKLLSPNNTALQIYVNCSL